MTSPAPEPGGSCHCGAVTFTVKGPITRASRCTCSICSRLDAVWYATDDAGLTIVSGEDELGLYQFGTMTAKHYFCRHCGIHPFSRPRINPKMWVVNLRCMPEVDIDALPVSTFDGAHFDEAARALLSRGKPAAS